MFEAIVMGASAGGLKALATILSTLQSSFRAPVAIVQHLDSQAGGYLVEYLNGTCAITVKEAEEKEPLCAGTAYIAPAGYHLLIEADRSFSLSIDPKINYCRPAIDVLFESAADVYNRALIGIVLTGANGDGAQGLAAIKRCGGLAIVQNPDTAEARFMPQAAMDLAMVDHVLDLEQIGPLVDHLMNGTDLEERRHG